MAKPERTVRALDWRRAPAGATIRYADSAFGLTVGLWAVDARAVEARAVEARAVEGALTALKALGPGAGCLLLGDGAAELRDGSGRRLAAGAGVAWDGAGPPGLWATADARGVFLHRAGPAPEAAACAVIDAAAIGRAQLRTGALKSAAAPDAPSDRDHGLFGAQGDAVAAGLWESAPFETALKPFSYHELALVLDGTAVIETPDAPPWRFAPGDAFFIAQGARCRWRVAAPILKAYATADEPVA
ncbi:MAG: cupin domain-containing protein [Alphaproteobacteria bacterium]|nr:cupin domain-containing protein [Alphaproteobacteria bacterium]